LGDSRGPPLPSPNPDGSRIQFGLIPGDLNLRHLS
jgi:hypothetical protein